MKHAHYVDELASNSRSIGRTIPIESVEPNPEQPRVEIGDLTELTESIKEKGVLEPLLVQRSDTRGKWMIVAGERRWRASKLAGLTEVPCIEMDLDEKGVAEIALIENLQRKDLTIWEEADGLAALSERFGYTHDEIAKKISKSRSTVTELMTIAGLPEEIRARCRESKITAKSTLLEIARQFDEAGMFDYLSQLTNGKSKREAGRKSPAQATRSESGREPSAVSADGKFTYDAADKRFRVEIGFTIPPENSKRAVLQALKQAFDDVKNGVVQV